MIESGITFAEMRAELQKTYPGLDIQVQRDSVRRSICVMATYETKYPEIFVDMRTEIPWDSQSDIITSIIDRIRSSVEDAKYKENQEATK